MKKMLDLHIRNPGVPSPAQKRYKFLCQISPKIVNLHHNTDIMDNSNKVSRRDFLKITGAAGAAAILTAGCASDKDGH